MRNIKTKLINAIENKHKIIITYKDDTKTRTVYPHVLYKNKNGLDILDAYQVEGFSSSGSRFPEWKQFNIKLISTIEVTPDIFQPIQSFNPNSLRYTDKSAIIS